MLKKRRRLSLRKTKNKANLPKNKECENIQFYFPTINPEDPASSSNTEGGKVLSEKSLELNRVKRSLDTSEKCSNKVKLISSSKKKQKTPKKLSDLLHSTSPNPPGLMSCEELLISTCKTKTHSASTAKKKISFGNNFKDNCENDQQSVSAIFESCDELSGLFDNVDLDQFNEVTDNRDRFPSPHCVPYQHDFIDYSRIIANKGLYNLPPLYIVNSVTRQRSEKNRNSGWPEELVLKVMAGDVTYDCYLQDIWSQTDVRVGDVVQLLGCLYNATAPLPADSTAKGTRGIVISEEDYSAIIVNPDYLISSTSIAGSGISCTRRAVMEEVYKGSSPTNEWLLFGSLLHCVFQKAIVYSENGGCVNEDYIRQLIVQILSDSDTLDKMYALCLTDTYVLDKMDSYIPAIISWCGTFLSSDCNDGKPSNRMEVRKFWDVSGDSAKVPVDVSLTAVKDIEENVWSPRFGLKGKIDATTIMKVTSDMDGKVTLHENITPLEVKTGKMISKMGSIEHRAQVMLYCLMMRDVYKTNVSAGILFYMKENHTHLVPTAVNEIRALLVARNHLARYHGNHWDHVTLPEMIKERFTCQHCPVLKQCTLYYRAFEGGSAKSSCLGNHFPPAVENIPITHLQFFRHWYSLAMEETAHCQEEQMKERIVWRKTIQQREESGYCISGLMACPMLTPPTSNTMNGFIVQQEFKRERPLSHSSNLGIGDRIFISVQENDHYQWGVALGYILTIDKHGTSVMLMLERAVPDNGIVYTIDLREAPTGQGMGVANLAELCLSDNERDHRLRELIIEGAKPVCNAVSCIATNDDTTIHEIKSHLSMHQREAVEKVLLARDYSLVLGMPGTGKTSIITQLVRILVAMGKTVLLTSFTNSAVDNVLLRLLNEGVEFVRVGSKGKVHPSIQPYSTQELSKSTGNVSELSKLYSTKSVVASTCHGVQHAIFSHRYFDYCIIDEASQIPLPLSIGPVQLARVFILVGDHHQLPPLVTSPTAKANGYDISLFKLLSEFQPDSVVSLTRQYRMNREIMNVSNHLIYKGRLECASEEVATATLNIPKWSLACSELQYPMEWLKMAVDPTRPVCFLNTDKCGDCLEESTGGIVTNLFEANTVRSIIDTLIKYGVPPSDILVITQYRHQQRLILKLLKTGNEVESVEVLTIDKCQGRDRSCVILSFVRSNSNGKVGHLVTNLERINVAITRAKHKLLMIGSVSTLSTSEWLRQLLQLLKNQSQIIDIILQ